MSIEIRKGDIRDLDAFAALLYEVHEKMEHKEWFCLDEPEEFRRQMERGTMELWLAMDGERVAGALNLLMPGLEDINYGYALGFSAEQLMRVVNLDTAAVHPDYRGQGLQRRLLQTAEAWLQSGEERILLCTVHPENRFSLQNALRQGYVIMKELPMYGSVRYILRKDLKKQS